MIGTAEVGASAFVAWLLSSCKGTPSATETGPVPSATWSAQARATIEAQEAEITRQGLQIQQLDARVSSLSASPTPSATLPPTETHTPEPTATPDRVVERVKIMGNPENNRWDARDSLMPPREITAENVELWMKMMGNAKVLGWIKDRDVKTYDRMAARLSASNRAGFTTLTDSRVKQGIDNEPLSEFRHEWTASLDDGQLPKAKEFAPMMLKQARDVLRNVLRDEPTNKKVNELYVKMVFGALKFGLASTFNSEWIACQTTYPAGEVQPAEQTEWPICTVYHKGIDRGKEYVDWQGVLHKSNEAQLQIAFTLSTTPPVNTVTDISRQAVVEIPSAGGGTTYYWEANVADFWSQTPKSVVGPTPIGADGGDGSELRPQCGPAATETPTPQPTATQQPSIEQGGGGGGGGGGNHETPQPTKEKSGNPNNGDDRGQPGNTGDDSTIPGQP